MACFARTSILFSWKMLCFLSIVSAQFSRRRHVFHGKCLEAARKLHYLRHRCCLFKINLEFFKGTLHIGKGFTLFPSNPSYIELEVRLRWLRKKCVCMYIYIYVCICICIYIYKLYTYITVRLIPISFRNKRANWKRNQIEGIVFSKAILFFRHIEPFKCLQFADEKVARSGKNIHYIMERKPTAMETQFSKACVFQRRMDFSRETRLDVNCLSCVFMCVLSMKET